MHFNALRPINNLTTALGLRDRQEFEAMTTAETAGRFSDATADAVDANGVPESQGSPASRTRKRVVKPAHPRLIAHYDTEARELAWTWTR